MLLPYSVSKKDECFKLINNILYDNIDNESEEASQSISELTKETFFDSPDYRIVYKNFDYLTSYDTWIYEGNKDDKIVGYKYIQSYPYDEVKFKVGDYVHWNYNHKELSTWLITSLDMQYLYNVKGRMLQCNNSLKWTSDNGELNCYPCVIKDAMTYTNFKWGNTGVVQNAGDIVVLVQKNEYTKKILINDRFIFSGVAFKVKQFLNEVDMNYMEIYMMKSSELYGDNLNENIAINDVPEVKIEKQGITLTPNTKRITLGETVEFTIVNYINSVLQADTFTINVKNVPNSYYELNIINGNKFSIKNLKQYNSNPLLLECIDNTNGEKIQENIWLGGSW